MLFGKSYVQTFAWSDIINSNHLLTLIQEKRKRKHKHGTLYYIILYYIILYIQKKAKLDYITNRRY